MECLEAKQKLEPCARGELGAAERIELDRHIETCEGCRLELELTRAVLGSETPGSSPSPDPISLEPSIEQERVPELPTEGPGPPRVLTSQLPEDAEETLDLESLHAANAYDPGAIDLPHAEPSPAFETRAPAVAPESFSDESLSFADLTSSGPAAAGSPKSPSAGAPAGSGAGGSWGFEPVDVPRASAPPEESLSFAKEALDRKRGKALQSRKGAKVLLGVVGAVGGVGLLGASVWMALAFRGTPAGQDPSNVPALEPPPGVQQQAPAPADSMAPASEGTPGLTATDSTAAPGSAPSVLKAGMTGSGAMAGMTPGIAPKPVAGAAPSAAGSGTQPAPAKPSESTGKPVASPPGVAFRDDELAPAPRREPQILRVEPDAPPGAEPGYEPMPDPSVSREPTKSVSTAPIFVPPSSSTKTQAGTSAKPEEAASGPIGRLHVATVTAEKNRDLEALRKLKEPWKSLIRSMTGADRSRSKREYADCLWAIQEITNREADRKEALTAYREYVLHAPAGGADARTVSRMRHLEDFLSDSQ